MATNVDDEEACERVLVLGFSDITVSRAGDTYHDAYLGKSEELLKESGAG